MADAGAVAVAFIHADEVAYSWHTSMMGMLMRDMTGSQALARGGILSNECGVEGLPKARNQIAAAAAEGSAEWLLWVDTDMGFLPDAAERLLEAADPAQRPVVGALCFAQRKAFSDAMGGWQTVALPVIHDWARPGDPMGGFEIRFDYPQDAVTRCAGTGSAFILIHRSVFQRIAAEYGPAWYDLLPSPVPGEVISEDLSFCARAGALGIPVHVHTGVRTTHMKRAWLGEGDYQQQPFAGLPPIAQRIG